MDQREALILVCATGLSYEEAADVCQVAVGTIKSRIARARDRLVELLGDDAALVTGPPVVGALADVEVRRNRARADSEVLLSGSRAQRRSRPLPVRARPLRSPLKTLKTAWHRAPGSDAMPVCVRGSW